MIRSESDTQPSSLGAIPITMGIAIREAKQASEPQPAGIKSGVRRRAFRSRRRSFKRLAAGDRAPQANHAAFACTNLAAYLP